MAILALAVSACSGSDESSGGCPTFEPAAGAPCALASAVPFCQYELACGGFRAYDCVDGGFVLGGEEPAGCCAENNFCDGSGAGCPDVEPAGGDACQLTAAEPFCLYDLECDGFRAYDCTDGLFVLGGAEEPGCCEENDFCNAPVVGCPQTEPQQGQTCELTEDEPFCQYDQLCGGFRAWDCNTGAFELGAEEEEGCCEDNDFCGAGPAAVCGDGTVGGDEECDDNNTDPDDGCDPSCQFECGNGTVEVNEQCDDSNRDNADGCDADCFIECGNGDLDGDEECDDSNTDPDDGCSSACTLECGDGRITGSEECDDDNAEAGDGCSDICRIETLSISNHASARVALGQSSIDAAERDAGEPTANARGLWLPIGTPVWADGRLYVLDAGNSRILIYNEFPTATDTIPDGVIGTQDLNGGPAPGPNGGTLGGFSRHLATDGTRLAVAEPQRHRVQVFEPIPAEDAAPSLVLGEDGISDTTTAGLSRQDMDTPFAVAVGGGRMAVVDHNNHRVLLWNSIPTANNPPADNVIGQSDFDSGAQNAGGPVSASSLLIPGCVWTDGTRLAVCDGGNHRILLWNSWPTRAGQPADVVIGQPNFTSSAPGLGDNRLNEPGGFSVYGRQVIVTDTMNHRVLIFDDWPGENWPNATRVIGQPDFNSNASASDSRSLARPSGASVIQRRLVVADTFNNRIVIY